MKPVYKCDYCSFMGTEEEVREHESECYNNYDRRSCHTCKYKRTIPCKSENTITTEWTYKCELGKEIPDGKYFIYCDSHERKEEQSFADLLFGRW